jgi:hypothetical protein
MDLRVEEQRTEPRVAVQFQAMVSGSMESEGTGTILDLSQSGCRLESQLLMLPGLSLELRIAAPGFEWALMIDGLMCSEQMRTAPDWLLSAYHNRAALPSSI